MTSSKYDPDVGVSNPNRMRDKNVLELKAKHNFYIMPTLNANNLRLNTQKYKNEIDNETLTLYSGGGYIAKSRLGSSYSKRRGTGFGSKKLASNRAKRITKRFNEQLDTASQKSVNQRRAISRGLAERNSAYNLSANRRITSKLSNADKESIKDQLIEKIERMDHEDIERMSKQIDEMDKGEQEFRKTSSGFPKEKYFNNQEQDNEFEREHYNTLEHPDDNKDEEKDEVKDLPESPTIKHDFMKSASELSEYGSRPRSKLTRSSKRSSKSYIFKLQKELDREKAERMKLESEIQELKKISSEISSRLGLNNS